MIYDIKYDKNPGGKQRMFHLATRMFMTTYQSSVVAN